MCLSDTSSFPKTAQISIDLLVGWLSLNLNIKATFLSALTDIQLDGKAGDP